MRSRAESYRGAGLIILSMVMVLFVAAVVSGVGTRDAEAAFPGGDGPVVFAAGGSIYLTSASGIGVEALTDCRDGIADNPTFNSQASRVAYDSEGIVYLLTLGEEPVALTQGRWPAWSANSLQVAFEREGNIYVINADGTGETLLVAGEQPAWTSNGLKIAFVTRSAEGASLSVIEPDGGNLAPLTQPVPGQQDLAPNWKSGADKVAFERIESSDVDGDGTLDHDIYSVDADGSNLQQITSTPGAETGPAWSPIGSQLVYSGPALDGTGTDILRAQADGSNVVVLKDVGASDVSPDWGVGGTAPSSAPPTKTSIPSPTGTIPPAEQAPSFKGPAATTSQRSPQCGGAGDDRIEGTSGNDVLVGGPGDDVIVGGGGNDRIFGGGGNDLIIGGPGDDELYGQGGDDTIWGDKEEGDGSARAMRRAARSLQATAGGDDFIDGGGDNDLAFGGGGRDKIFGRKGKDRLWGRTGNDRILGNDGPDKLYGQEGDDYLDGGDGVDRFRPGEGTDTCVLDNKRDRSGGCEKERRHFRRHF